MDAALRLNLVKCQSKILSVSILVLVDAALRLSSLFYIAYTIFVSILVLVDAALRLEGETYRIGKVPGFNPCFSGCRPATG